MKKKILPIVYLLCLVFSLSDCRKEISNLVDEEPAEGIYPNVNEALWPYFKRFEIEASIRNISIDLREERISGVISDIPINHVLGQCSYSSAESKKLTIDLPFWNTSSNLGKEFVIFHELGHCSLGRLHDETKDKQGICQSIMRSGLEECRDNYTSLTRKMYLDELFLEN
ncbi:MAG: hypothetical protein ABIR66_13230 [Saprospiraceae bacterium]